MWRCALFTAVLFWIIFFFVFFFGKFARRKKILFRGILFRGWEIRFCNQFFFEFLYQKRVKHYPYACRWRYRKRCRLYVWKSEGHIVLYRVPCTFLVNLQVFHARLRHPGIWNRNQIFGLVASLNHLDNHSANSLAATVLSNQYKVIQQIKTINIRKVKVFHIEVTGNHIWKSSI